MTGLKDWQPAWYKAAERWLESGPVWLVYVVAAIGIAIWSWLLLSAATGAGTKTALTAITIFFWMP